MVPNSRRVCRFIVVSDHFFAITIFIVSAVWRRDLTRDGQRLTAVRQFAPIVECHVGAVALTQLCRTMPRHHLPMVVTALLATSLLCNVGGEVRRRRLSPFMPPV